MSSDSSRITVSLSPRSCKSPTVSISKLWFLGSVVNVRVDREESGDREARNTREDPMH